MSVTKTVSSDGTELSISVDGRFDFGVQSDFRAAYEGAGFNSYVIDLAKAEYMDSSALGMLLMMREFVKKQNGTITITNCSNDVKAILNVANFHSLFTIN